MDSLLCLWDKRIVKCDNMYGHSGSVSKVLTDEFNIGISSSYDGSLIVWNLDSKTEAAKLSKGHKGPVLNFAWRNSLVVSGDK